MGTVLLVLIFKDSDNLRPVWSPDQKPRTRQQPSCEARATGAPAEPSTGSLARLERLPQDGGQPWPRPPRRAAGDPHPKATTSGNGAALGSGPCPSRCISGKGQAYIMQPLFERWADKEGVGLNSLFGPSSSKQGARELHPSFYLNSEGFKDDRGMFGSLLPSLAHPYSVLAQCWPDADLSIRTVILLHQASIDGTQTM